MIPGIIACIILSGSGVAITLDTTVTSTNATSIYEVLDNTNVVTVLNSTVNQVESKTSYFTLENPVWVTFHYMLALIMFAFVITRVLQMLLFKE